MKYIGKIMALGVMVLAVSACGPTLQTVRQAEEWQATQVKRVGNITVKSPKSKLAVSPFHSLQKESAWPFYTVEGVAELDGLYIYARGEGDAVTYDLVDAILNTRIPGCHKNEQKTKIIGKKIVKDTDGRWVSMARGVSVVLHYSGKASDRGKCKAIDGAVWLRDGLQEFKASAEDGVVATQQAGPEAGGNTIILEGGRHSDLQAIEATQVR